MKNPLKQPIHVLYLCPRYLYLHKMDRVRFNTVKAIEKKCSVLWSGPGWDNWNDLQTLKENVENIYKNKSKPDLIFCYEPFEIKEFWNISIPTCISFNEMAVKEHPISETIREIEQNKIDIVICHHKNEMEHLAFQQLPCKMVNISHCIDINIFKDYGLDKTIDVLLIGNTHPGRYPLRNKLSEIIFNMRTDPLFEPYKIGIHHHPGSRVKDATTDAEGIRLAKAINKSKICLTCSGIYKCRYAKYSEIPGSRSLLMADIPNDGVDFFKQFVVEISISDSYKKISNRILYYLKDEQERERKTDIGYCLTKKNYSQDDYADYFLSIANEYLSKNGHKKLWKNK